MRRKKRLGFAVMAIAIVILVAAEALPGIASLFLTLGAMLVGGVGMYLAFDDTERP
ncbi:hypothetical protein GALL_314310 [mine drainage metagenome]|uniref:Uncharacterized protein n=1 Tax=mine drainage metagenome TaxID=410659 RepID=A0A1J5RAL7_9ZZZZ